jgi:hypothetical protein
VEINKTLVIVATAALTVINLASLTIGGLIVGALLVIAVLTFVRRNEIHENGLYALLVAEVTLLGLQSSIWLALLYQALCLLLLAATLASFGSLRPLSEYSSPLVKITVAASAFVAVTGVALYTQPFDLSGPQLLTIVTGTALLLFSVVFVTEHFAVRLQNLNILRTKP